MAHDVLSEPDSYLGIQMVLNHSISFKKSYDKLALTATIQYAGLNRRSRSWSSIIPSLRLPTLSIETFASK